jgi:hypothetical protein
MLEEFYKKETGKSVFEIGKYEHKVPSQKY